MSEALHTHRLVLRAFELADAPAVQRLASVAAVADTALNIPHPSCRGWSRTPGAG